MEVDEIVDVCMLCHQELDNEVLYGKLKFSGGIIVHHFCLLASTTLAQDGEDHEGIDGFLIPHVKQQIIKSNNTKCVYCELPNATAQCQYRNCGRWFHFPCGLNRGAVTQFMERYDSFCNIHNFLRNENMSYYDTIEDPTCIYCQEEIGRNDNFYITDCCRSCIVHIECLKQHAFSSGYFMKCPNCNSTDVFVEAIRRHGVFVPEVDTLWHTENDIREDFSCCMPVCKCPHENGRHHDGSSGFWILRVCRLCGGNAAHQKCKSTKGNRFICQICRPIHNRRIAELRRKRQIKAEMAAAAANLGLDPTINPKVFLVRLDLEALRRMGVKVPRYNFRPRNPKQ